MPLNSTVSLIQYTVTSLGQTLAFPYYFLNNADLTVVDTNGTSLLDASLTLGTDFTVANAGNPAGGSITLEGTGLHYAIGDTITIARVPVLTQPTNYQDGTAYPAAVDNVTSDWIVMQVQSLRDAIKRCLQLPLSGSPGSVPAMPLTLRANNVIGFDSNGNLAFYGNSAIGGGNSGFNGALNAFYGNSNAALSNLATANIVLGTMWGVDVGGPGGNLLWVRLCNTTANAVANAVIRGPDYNANTNPTQWIVIG